MTKLRTKPTHEDWNKYMDALKKKPVECITENLVP